MQPAGDEADGKEVLRDRVIQLAGHAGPLLTAGAVIREAALVFHRLLQPLGHHVEVSLQLAHLSGATHTDSLAKLTTGDLKGCAGEAAKSMDRAASFALSGRPGPVLSAESARWRTGTAVG